MYNGERWYLQVLGYAAQAMSRDNYKCLAIEYFEANQEVQLELPQLIPEIDSPL